MCLIPFDRITLNVTFAGMGGVEPIAEKAIFPDGAGGVIRAGNKPGMARTDRLARKWLADPCFALPAVVNPDMGILPAEFVVAKP
jgi:hypothetical protein